MTAQDPLAPALSLSAFLRALRERQSPAEFGLAAGPRRRTPGLRREEVAQLCGLSVTWYTWIEQGRDVSVSAPTLARLARGLRLSQHAEDQAWALRLNETRLYTNAAFTSNLAFYAKRGYIEFQRETIAPGAVAVHMRKRFARTR